MKMPKFLSMAVSITCFSLIYVHQQTEIFRLGYVSQKRQAVFDDLLDKNTVLRYNIARNASLVHLGDKLPGPRDLEMPNTYRLMRVASLKSKAKATQQFVKKETLLSRMFSVKRVAEARPINP